MERSKKTKVGRRRFLGGAAAIGAGLGFSALSQTRRAGAADDGQRFLIVLAGVGGASLLDAMLAVSESESDNAQRINAYPDAVVRRFEGSPFRAVDSSYASLGSIPAPVTAQQSDFVSKHQDDMLVATYTGTSVNHGVAQRRAVTGNDAWLGRTLQEATALTYGAQCPVPNVHLARGSGFTARGIDQSLPVGSYGELVALPEAWPLSLDGHAGLNSSVDRELFQRARELRNERLEPLSAFRRAFGSTPQVSHWRRLRGEPQQRIEAADLVNRLLFLPDGERFPLADHGLSPAPEAQRLLETFPRVVDDPLEAQAALSFLLLKNRVASSVTLGPSFDSVVSAPDEGGVYSATGIREEALVNPPIAFDYSHQAHRASQAFMWQRVLGVADRLIDLLKAEEYADGESLWDRSLIYVATEFGRSKTRPEGASDFGTAHDLNNGCLLLSPMVRGNTVLGGMDPHTGLTYGFDPATGEPEPGREMTERDIYAGIASVLGLETSGSGLPDMSVFRRG